MTQPSETEFDISELKKSSMQLESGMGAVAWAVLEMFRRGGMPEIEITALHEKMNRYFMEPTNAECNAILKVVEERLREDKVSSGDRWYV